MQKELKYTKRAGADLVGKVKAVIPQINHTDKWPNRKIDGKYVNKYSKLQDRYFEHMDAAGFPNLQRGERGSAAEHLTVEEYKYQQEKKRVEEAKAQVAQSEILLGELDEQAEKKKKRLGALDEQIAVKEKAKATLKEVDEMGHSLPLVPGVHFNEKEAAKLKSLAKKGVNADDRIKAAQDKQKEKIETLEGNIRNLNSQIVSLKHDVRTIATDRDTWKKNYERLWAEVKDFIHAIRRAPQRLFSLINEHLPNAQNKNREVSH